MCSQTITVFKISIIFKYLHTHNVIVNLFLSLMLLAHHFLSSFFQDKIKCNSSSLLEHPLRVTLQIGSHIPKTCFQIANTSCLTKKKITRAKVLPNIVPVSQSFRVTISFFSHLTDRPLSPTIRHRVAVPKAIKGVKQFLK